MSKEGGHPCPPANEVRKQGALRCIFYHLPLASRQKCRGSFAGGAYAHEITE